MRSESHTDVDRAARSWLLRLNAAAPDAALKAAFLSWLQADETHAAAFRRAEELWEDIGLTDTLAVEAERIEPYSPAAAASVAHDRTRRRLVARVAGLAAAVLVAIATAIWYLPPRAETLSYASALAETRAVELADGSVVTLGPDTAISASFGRDERSVILERGRARFAVARERDRRFSVATAQTRIDVLGTTFSVRQGEQSIDVAVLSGEVTVSAAADGRRGEHRELRGGQRVSADTSGALGEIGTVDEQAELGWLEGRLFYDGTPLIEVVHDLNSYRREKIRIVDPELEDLRITTSFRAEQADQVLDGLALTQPLRVEQRNGEVLLVSRHD